jgi:radical SAM protein with 4Fe4S-binding SPASM domain
MPPAPIKLIEKLASTPTELESPLDTRLASFYPKIREIKAGGVPYPRMAILYPVYGCTYDCLGCEYKQFTPKDRFTFLDTERYLRLNEELCDVGVEGIELCGGGEPTMHPQIVECTVHGGELGLRYGLLTNGSSFSQGFFERVLPYLSYVRISLDAASEEIYGRVRPGRGANLWGKVISNISRLVEERGRRGLAFDISLKFLVSAANIDQVEAFVTLAQELGADSAQFKALRCDPAELDQQQVESVERELSSLRRLHSSFPIFGSVVKVVMGRQCELTPLQVTIDAFGEVYLCCYFRHRPASHSIGNIFKSSFEELWGGERHRRAIAEVNPAECSVMDCRFVRYHDIVDRWFDERRDIFSFI